MSELTSPPPSRSGLWTAKRNRLALGYAMLAPVLVAVLFLRAWPIVTAVVGSVSSPKVTGPDFSIYADLLNDPIFLRSLLTTGLFSIVVNPIQILLALLLALLFNERIALGGLWRSLVILPIVIPQAISALIWGVALRPDGPINAVLNAMGLPSQGFLITTQWAMPSIVVVCSWVGVGYWMMFLLAGLKDVPSSLYEAAVIDGAGRWQKFWYVTLPMLRRPLLFVLVADTIANFLVFGPVQILTNGGPRHSTNFVMMEVYTRTFVYSDYAGGAAETVIVTAIVLVVVLIQFQLLRGGSK